MPELNMFLGTKGSRSAKIMFVGESYGKTEETMGRPFVGESGQDLDKLCGEAGIPLNDCFYTNVVNERPPNNDMYQFFYTTREAKQYRMLSTNRLYPRENVLQGLEQLRAQIDAIKPKIIIGLGNYTLWALTNESFNIGNLGGYKIPTGISQWRGSQLYTSSSFGRIPFLPTYHPAAGLRTYPWRYMIKHDLKARVKLALNDDALAWKEPDYDFILRPNLEQVCSRLESFLTRLDSGQLELAADLETRDGLIACIGLADTPRRAICIPFLCEENDAGYWSVEEELLILILLRKIFNHPNLSLVGQNFLYDLQYIVDQMFASPRLALDTMYTHHVVWPGGGDPNSAKASLQGIQQKALYNLSSLYCEHHVYWKDEGKNWTKESEDVLWNYNCKDSVKTLEIARALRELIADFGLEEQFAFQMRVINEMLLPMMKLGIKVDKVARAKVAQELLDALSALDIRLAPLVAESLLPSKRGSKPWYRSPTKQKRLFYEVLGIAPVIKKGSKNATTDKDALPIIAQREPIVKHLIDLLELRRSIGVYHSTFAEAEAEPDGRMRCSYNPSGTDTFRLSSSENIYGRGGNMQNIPSGKEEEAYDFPNMRKAFVPDAGYEIAEFDLSGADAQVVAWEADDADLMQAFRSGVKIHLKNSRDLFPNETANMTDDEIKAGSGIPGSIYDSIKKGVHATNYGGAAQTLSTRLRWKVEKAIEFQERWFHLHPGVKEWHNRTHRQLSGLQCWRCNTLTAGSRVCQSCGAITGRTIGNRFGYRIVYFDRIGDLFTKSLAWTPQSTVAINTNKGAIAIREFCPWVELLLQVHDSLIVQWPIKYGDRVDEIKRALYTISVPYKSPLTIGWGLKISRESWGAAETVNW